MTFAPQPRSVKFMPRSAARTRSDQAQAEFFAKREALKETEAEDKAGADAAKVTPTSGTKPPRATAKKKAK